MRKPPILLVAGLLLIAALLGEFILEEWSKEKQPVAPGELSDSIEKPLEEVTGDVVTRLPPMRGGAESEITGTSHPTEKAMILLFTVDGRRFLSPVEIRASLVEGDVEINLLVEAGEVSLPFGKWHLEILSSKFAFVRSVVDLPNVNQRPMIVEELKSSILELPTDGGAAFHAIVGFRLGTKTLFSKPLNVDMPNFEFPFRPKLPQVVFWWKEGARFPYFSRIRGRLEYQKIRQTKLERENSFRPLPALAWPSGRKVENAYLDIPKVGTFSNMDGRVPVPLRQDLFAFVSPIFRGDNVIPRNSKWPESSGENIWLLEERTVKLVWPTEPGEYLGQVVAKWEVLPPIVSLGDLAQSNEALEDIHAAYSGLSHTQALLSGTNSLVIPNGIPITLTIYCEGFKSIALTIPADTPTNYSVTLAFEKDFASIEIECLTSNGQPLDFHCSPNYAFHLNGYGQTLASSNGIVALPSPASINSVLLNFDGHPPIELKRLESGEDPSGKIKLVLEESWTVRGEFSPSQDFATSGWVLVRGRCFPAPMILTMHDCWRAAQLEGGIEYFCRSSSPFLFSGLPEGDWTFVVAPLEQGHNAPGIANSVNVPNEGFLKLRY